MKKTYRFAKSFVFSIKDINANCLDQFKAHYECLEQNNHHLWQCRRPENALNTCVFDKLVCVALVPKKRHDADIYG